MTGGRLWTLPFKRLLTRKPTLKTHQPAAEFAPILMLTKKPPRKRWLISNYSEVPIKTALALNEISPKASPVITTNLYSMFFILK